jgi:hypothetical protein
MRSELNRFRIGQPARITETIRTPVAGIYQRKKGTQASYTYEGAYGATSDCIWWLVEVRSNGKFKGTPTGMLDKQRKLTHKVITTLIEEQIENLDQITE